MRYELRFAERIHSEAMDALWKATGAIKIRDAARYEELVAKAMPLLGAARWAADKPHLGRQLMIEHGLELPESEAPTEPATPRARARRKR